MSSGEEGQPIVSQPSALKHLRGRRVKIFLCVVASLCLIAALSVGAAVISHKEESKNLVSHEADSLDMEMQSKVSKNSLGRVSRSLEDDQPENDENENEEGEERPKRNHQRATINPRRGRHPSCVSDPSNTTIPAAHIKGAKQSHLVLPGPRAGEYEQVWQCDEFEGMNTNRGTAQAFVDGGMRFNQTEKTLYVPSCGYYHIYSQTLFNLNHPSPEARTVFHNLKFKRNCPTEPEGNYITIQGQASIGPFSRGSGTATTYAGEVVKMCENGEIKVQFLSANPCCPSGNPEGTFFGAVLIANTTCDWPPRTTLEHDMK